MKEKLLKLLEVKSIISLITAFVFAYLSVKQILGAESVMAIIILVFKFFFDYQESKNKNNKGDKE